MNYELTLQQAENHQADAHPARHGGRLLQSTSRLSETLASDGFGKSKSADDKTLLKIWIKVRKDSQIPEFDTITECKWSFEGEDNLRKYTERLVELVNENGGIFVEDALKLQERDIFSMVDEKIHPSEAFVIPALRALKKAIVNYFENTKQDERMRKATETIICHCRHVTDADIQESIEKGCKTLEEISMATGAGTGCNSCIGRVTEILSGRKKTALGKFN
ncbi:(2Fe-2S)-binding protein [Candidatus Peregrinibacteria bacterium]|nr:(2Fe-2S)-binding protein [Candidatus Peregrinibacteria bacterium]